MWCRFGWDKQQQNMKGRFMSKKLMTALALCAACLVLGAQAQSSGSAGSSSGSTYPGSSGSSSSGSSSGSTYGGSSGSQSGQSSWDSGRSGRLSATGRMGHHDLQASKLTGASVQSTSGETLGTINDVIINPGSGRIECAVISLSSSSSSSSPSGASSSPG